MKEYQSKLEAGQLAWFIRENKVVSMPVGAVRIRDVVHNEEGEPAHTSITYSFRIYGARNEFKDWEEHKEYECFATKQELLASL
jgi:hypothetical protein